MNRLIVVGLASLAACASSIPRAEIDRCNLGTADGNDALLVRQGAACRMIAQRLASEEKSRDAMGFARKACELEDARGCEQYLALVRAQSNLPADDLQHARATGEKACAGIVVAQDGVDRRPAICVAVAELYLDLEPKSRQDAGRMYLRACKLGENRSCARAKWLGVAPEERAAAKTVSKSSPPPPPPLPPPPAPTSVPMPPGANAPLPTSVATAAPAVACHEMKSCVALDVHQRNTTEVVGTIASHCDRAALCQWCPAKGSEVDKSQCRTATLAPNETKTGREAGLWYDGFTAIAYDCVDAKDDKGCL